MNITSTSSLSSPILDALRRSNSTQGGAAATGKPDSFQSAFDAALKSVSKTQNEASDLARTFQTNPDSVSLEETMIAMQKSQIAFQSALHVRNKMVSAYSDIMNMQV
jgi:flagellar hook-basal body complex protein FliE